MSVSEFVVLVFSPVLTFAPPETAGFFFGGEPALEVPVYFCVKVAATRKRKMPLFAIPQCQRHFHSIIDRHFQCQFSIEKPERSARRLLRRSGACC